MRRTLQQDSNISKDPKTGNCKLSQTRRHKVPGGRRNSKARAQQCLVDQTPPSSSCVNDSATTFSSVNSESPCLCVAANLEEYPMLSMMVPEVPSSSGTSAPIVYMMSPAASGVMPQITTCSSPIVLYNVPGTNVHYQAASPRVCTISDFMGPDGAYMGRQQGAYIVNFGFQDPVSSENKHMELDKARSSQEGSPPESGHTVSETGSLPEPQQSEKSESGGTGSSARTSGNRKESESDVESTREISAQQDLGDTETDMEQYTTDGEQESLRESRMVLKKISDRAMGKESHTATDGEKESLRESRMILKNIADRAMGKESHSTTGGEQEASRESRMVLKDIAERATEKGSQSTTDGENESLRESRMALKDITDRAMGKASQRQSRRVPLTEGSSRSSREADAESASLSQTTSTSSRTPDRESQRGTQRVTIWQGDEPIIREKESRRASHSQRSSRLSQRPSQWDGDRPSGQKNERMYRDKLSGESPSDTGKREWSTDGGDTTDAKRSSYEQSPQWTSEETIKRDSRLASVPELERESGQRASDDAVGSVVERAVERAVKRATEQITGRAAEHAASQAVEMAMERALQRTDKGSEDAEPEPKSENLPKCMRRSIPRRKVSRRRMCLKMKGSKAKSFDFGWTNCSHRSKRGAAASRVDLRRSGACPLLMEVRWVAPSSHARPRHSARASRRAGRFVVPQCMRPPPCARVQQRLRPSPDYCRRASLAYGRVPSGVSRRQRRADAYCDSRTRGRSRDRSRGRSYGRSHGRSHGRSRHRSYCQSRSRGRSSERSRGRSRRRYCSPPSCGASHRPCSSSGSLSGQRRSPPEDYPVLTDGQDPAKACVRVRLGDLNAGEDVVYHLHYKNPQSCGQKGTFVTKVVPCDDPLAYALWDAAREVNHYRRKMHSTPTDNRCPTCADQEEQMRSRTSSICYPAAPEGGSSSCAYPGRQRGGGSGGPVASRSLCGSRCDAFSGRQDDDTRGCRCSCSVPPQKQPMAQPLTCSRYCQYVPPEASALDSTDSWIQTPQLDQPIALGDGAAVAIEQHLEPKEQVDLPPPNSILSDATTLPEPHRHKAQFDTAAGAMDKHQKLDLRESRACCQADAPDGSGGDAGGTSDAPPGESNGGPGGCCCPRGPPRCLCSRTHLGTVAQGDGRPSSCASSGAVSKSGSTTFGLSVGTVIDAGDSRPGQRSTSGARAEDEKEQPGEVTCEA